MKKLFEYLKPCFYKYNDRIPNLETDKYTMGIMAQDIRMGIEASGFNPDEFSIVQKDDTGYYHVKYVQLIPVLVAKIKELEEEINQIKKDINGKVS